MGKHMDRHSYQGMCQFVRYKTRDSYTFYGVGKRLTALVCACAMIPFVSACSSPSAGLVSSPASSDSTDSSTSSSLSASSTRSSSQRHVVSRPPRNPSSLTVGYVGVGDTEGPRAAQMERATIRGLRAAGIRVMTFRSLSLNPQPQITAAQSFANKGIDALIVNPQFSNVWGDAFATIRDMGIKVILLDRTPLGMPQSRYDASLGANYDQLGRQMAQWVLGKLGRWTSNDQPFEYGALPHSLIVSSLLGSAPDTKATTGWENQAGWLMDTIDTVAVGEVHETALSRLADTWEQCEKSGVRPHIIFATNQMAADVTLDFCKKSGIRTVSDPAAAYHADLTRKDKDPWTVAIVAIGGRGWLTAQSRAGRLAGGISVPTNYAARLIHLLSCVCADIPIAKDEVVPGTLVTAPSQSESVSLSASSESSKE